ncbi:MAG TPA: hypothetical protein VJY99_17715 [Buttiauxella sp.]|uniref:hypothetical protein n=1 Tax=Buttiauxella sp. TaxID=1972222 RepID=UPI002B45951E|nr:hypothetical protein [Buttiauxella sp.]HKM98509.1 hypothetical protein [Buttiauxella sp.]
MMRIYSAFVAHRDSDTPQLVARAPGVLAQSLLAWASLFIWIVLALLTGYYAHYHWLQRFPPMTSEAKITVENDYRLSDMHYVFKKQPLPTRPITDMSDENTVVDDVETPEYIGDDEFVAEDDVTPPASQTRKDSLREQVQKALAEMDE